MTTPQPRETMVFRAAIRPPFLFLVPVVLVGGICVGAVPNGLSEFNAEILIGAAALAVAWSFANAWLLSRMYPIRISKAGLEGFTVWGGRLFVHWQEIAAARKFRLVNLSWLRVYSSQHRGVLWLPLFLARKEEFVEAVHHFAPLGSPISDRIS